MSLSDSARGALAPNLGVLAASVASLSGWRRAAFSLALGAGSALSFAPLHLWPLLFLILPCFIWLLDGVADTDRETGRKPRWRQAALAGWWFGFGFFAAGLYWVGFAFMVEAEKFAWLLPLPVLAFPAALALFFAAACAAAIAVWKPGVHRIFVLAAAFFAADWLRGHILTGFPWNLWGYALAGNEALAQTASIFGIYSLTLIALVIFASPAALAGPSPRKKGRGWVLPAICLGLLLIGWGWGTARLSAASEETVPGVQLRVVQANIPQAEKWKPENREWIFNRLLRLSKEASSSAGGSAKITHLIWPETAIPILFMLNDKIYASDVKSALAELLDEGQHLIVGAERVEGTKRPDERYNIDHVFNSLFVVADDGTVDQIYDKVHLVPFGEYLPFETLLGAIGLEQITHVKFGFSSGESRPLMETPAAPAFLPLICYEVIFPAYVTGDEGRPGWLLNLTNDAWFGTSSGPYQHLHQARLRAIEQGLPLVRAANTGISTIIDAYGRKLSDLPLNEIGVIDHGLPVALEPTPYARWGKIWLILVAFTVVILYRFACKVE